MSAGEQVTRLLTLVPFLHARGRVDGRVDLDAAAALLGVDRDQVVSDLKVLFMCGLPGGYPDDLIDVDIDALEGEHGDGVIRVGNADYLDRPLRLSPTEASAVIVALRALRHSAEEETRAVVDRVLAKLEAAAASGSAAALVPALVDPGSDEAGGALDRLARDLRDATERGRQVRLRYWVPARDEVSERVVDPRGLVDHDGHAYLDAYCHSAEAPRLFRLDRVEAAEVLDSAVTSAPARPRTPTASLLGAATETPRVTLRLRPEARWVADYHAVEGVRPAPHGPEGAVDLELPVADERWLTRLLLRLAPHAEVVGPRSYADAVARAADATLTLYEPRRAPAERTGPAAPGDDVQ